MFAGSQPPDTTPHHEPAGLGATTHELRIHDTTPPTDTAHLEIASAMDQVLGGFQPGEKLA
jgi:hypothetical protein